MSTINFAIWLDDQLTERKWNQAELARRSGLTPAAISRMINGRRGPGLDACQKIADALGLPVTNVLHIAGLISGDESPREIREKIIAYNIEELTDDQQEEVKLYIEIIKERDRRRITYKQKRKREGETPPEAIKE